VSKPKPDLPPMPDHVLETRVVNGVERTVPILPKSDTITPLDPAVIAKTLECLRVSSDTPTDCGICGKTNPAPDCMDGWHYSSSGASICAAHRAKVNHERTSRLLAEIGIDETKFSSGWNAMKLEHESWKTAHRIAQQLHSIRLEALNLVFWGPLGVGKTHAALLICRDAVTLGMTVVRIRWSDFVRRVRATFADDAQETEDALVRTISSADLLLIDEITEDHTEFAHRLLRDVLMTRDDAKRPTLITTNATLKELRAALEKRAADRFFARLFDVCFDGPKYRDQEAATVSIAKLKSTLRGSSTPPVRHRSNHE
jgi:DNA replication protein DnaC